MLTTSELLAQANSYQQMGRLREAVAVCRQLLALEPGAFGAWHMLGVLDYQQGRIEAAANDFLRAVQLNPSFAEAHNNLGIALQVLNRTEESLNESFPGPPVKVIELTSGVGRAGKPPRLLNAKVPAHRSTVSSPVRPLISMGKGVAGTPAMVFVITAT